MSTTTNDTIQANLLDGEVTNHGLEQVEDFLKAHPDTSGTNPGLNTDHGTHPNGVAHSANDGMNLGTFSLDPTGSRAAANARANDANAHIDGNAHSGSETTNAPHIGSNVTNGVHAGDHANSDGTIENEAGADGPPNNNGPPSNGGVAADAEEPKDPNHITIRIQENGNELSFKIKRTTRLGRVMASYADRTNRTRAVMRFIYDGDRVLDDATPESLEMEDQDVIEVHQEQLGGGS